MQGLLGFFPWSSELGSRSQFSCTSRSKRWDNLACFSVATLFRIDIPGKCHLIVLNEKNPDAWPSSKASSTAARWELQLLLRSRAATAILP